MAYHRQQFIKDRLIKKRPTKVFKELLNHWAQYKKGNSYEIIKIYQREFEALNELLKNLEGSKERIRILEKRITRLKQQNLNNLKQQTILNKNRIFPEEVMADIESISKGLLEKYKKKLDAEKCSFESNY